MTSTTTTTEPAAHPGSEVPDDQSEALLVERPARASKLTSVEIMETYGLRDAEYSVLLRTVCKHAPREIAAFFMLFCLKRGLDPFSKQVYLWADKMENGVPVPGCTWNIVAGIDGLRAIASRSPYYRGPKRPIWTYEADPSQPDGIRRFTKEDSRYGNIVGKRVPEACEVAILRAVPQAPTNPAIYMEFIGIARFGEFCKTRTGKVYGNWEDQPEHQLRVRAEAMALRMAFPEEVGGIYTEDELRESRAPQMQMIEGVPAEAPSFSEEVLALAKRAGWSQKMLEAQLQRYGDHGKLLDALATIVERTETSSRARARKIEVVPPAEAAVEPSAEKPEPGAQSGKIPANWERDQIEHVLAMSTQPMSLRMPIPKAPPETFESAQSDSASGSMSAQTRKALFSALQRRGIVERDARIGWAQRHQLLSVNPPQGSAGGGAPSFRHLSESDARRALDLLRVETPNGWRDRVMLSRCLACEQLHGAAHADDCPIDEVGRDD